MMEINYLRGSYELKIFFDNVNCTYILVEEGFCYMMPLHLLKNFESYTSSVYTGAEPALKSWYHELSESLRKQVMVAKTKLSQDEFFQHFQEPE